MLYRTYFHGDRPTEFHEDGENAWCCTHGGWIGKVKDGDELTLHHHHGSATYTSYKEHKEAGKYLNKYYGETPQ